MQAEADVKLYPGIFECGVGFSVVLKLHNTSISPPATKTAVY